MVERPDAHERPPEALKTVYKQWQKATQTALDNDEDQGQGIFAQLDDIDGILPEQLEHVFGTLLRDPNREQYLKPRQVYSVKSMPGECWAVFIKMRVRDLRTR